MIRFRGGRLRLACGAGLVALAAGGAAAPLPILPHVATPDAALYPDYLALALSHTQLADDPRWRPLHLTLAPGRAQPAVIVLPVQTQAFGFSPTFRALLGARLDQELQRRHVDASTQSDIVDWRGPFVRRSDDATVAAFAAEHPGAALLALYLGHDQQGHAFVTLGRTDAGKARLAHRRLDIPQDRLPALDAVTAALPGLLAELDLGASRPAAALAADRAGGCQAGDWELMDLAPAAGPVATACHALLMGTLMPDYLSLVADLTQPSAPDRLAWLARAWVEASALAAQQTALRSVASLAAFQLRLDDAQRSAPPLEGEPDVVVRPLARMLSAGRQAATSPNVSGADARMRYVTPALAGLPPFAAAVLLEHARFTEQFHETDLCALELSVPTLRPAKGCEEEADRAPRSTRRATRGQQQLLEAWRLAAAWQALYVEGELRGSADGIARTLRDLPARLAAHPFTRSMHFAVHAREAHIDSVDARLAAARERTLDYAQALATLQRDDALTRHVNMFDDKTLPGDYGDPTMARANDDVTRLRAVELADLWGGIALRAQGTTPPPAVFLAEGSFAHASIATQPAQPPLAGTTAAGSGGVPPSAMLAARPPHRRPSYDGRDEPMLPSREALLQAIAQNPQDMDSRTLLAIVQLKRGASLAEARRILDGRPRHGRQEDAIREGNDLALAGHLFYFAGETDVAAEYYRRVVQTGTYSESDLAARARLASIAGDARAALAANHARSERYQSEWAAADEASYLFMLGRPDPAWSLILPRVQTAQEGALWRAAIVGHKMAATPIEQLLPWLVRNHLDKAQLRLLGPFAAAWLCHYADLDHQPGAAEIDLLKIRPNHKDAPWGPGLAVVAAAIDKVPTIAPDELDRDLSQAMGNDSRLLLPFHAWVTWNLSHGKDPILEAARATPLEAAFPYVLARAMVLAADGRRDEALPALAAARWELARTGSGDAPADALRSAPYNFVLASWLMTRQTGDRAYAAQGLAVARGFQHVVQFMGWPYAAEALLGTDAMAREVAACRALKLDPGSMMLHESGLHPDPNGALCRKATAW